MKQIIFNLLTCSVARYEELWENCVQVPLEGLAVKVLPQLLPGGDVSEVSLVVSDPLVVIVLVVVQPHLRRVVCYNHHVKSFLTFFLLSWGGLVETYRVLHHDVFLFFKDLLLGNI